MQLCRARSSGAFGRAVLRQVGRRGAQQPAVGRDLARDHAASGGAPKRMQTSKASSVNGGGLTESCNCTSHLRVLADEARDQRRDVAAPEAERRVDAQQPLGVALERRAAAPCPRSRRGCGAPAQVQLAFRRQAHAPGGAVDQWHADRASISARCLLTAGVVIPSSRAAALRLPARGQRREEAEVGGLDGARHVRRVRS